MHPIDTPAEAVSAPRSAAVRSEPARRWSTTVVAVVCAVSAMAAFVTPTRADTIYELVNRPAVQNGWTVTGYIKTDGTIGPILSSSVLDWSVAMTSGTTSHVISQGTGGIISTWSSISASGTRIENANGQLSFSSSDYTARYAIEGNVYGAIYEGIFSSGQLWATPYSTIATAGTAVVATVSAPVPEIDPAGLGSVLALVTGALGLIERRGRR